MSGHGRFHPLTVAPSSKGAGINAGGGDWKEQTGTESLGSRELIGCKIKVSCHLQPHRLARKERLNGVLLPGKSNRLGFEMYSYVFIFNI